LSPRVIGVALLGVGVVGSGVAEALAQRAGELAERTGARLALRHALVRDLQRPRPFVPPAICTDRIEPVLADPEVAIVIEVLGGEQPAADYIRRALEAGKHVVTANKEVIAKFGPELLAVAQERGVSLLFEAAVGGGVPLIMPLRRALIANRLSSLEGIINGTTNYILTAMAQQGLAFTTALAQAQSLGYAEPDPTNDIEAHDAAYKLAILASLAFHATVRPEQVYREGITRLTDRDFRYARELGYAIKLLAIAKDDGEAIEARVHPTLLPEQQVLAKVDGVFNAVQIDGDLVGRLLFYGRGAGARPTTSAILGDVLEIAAAIALGQPPRTGNGLRSNRPIRPIEAIQTRYYVRLTVADQPGVFARIAQVFADHAISISSVIQKESDEDARSAEIVIMTHRSREAGVRAALASIAELPVVFEVGNWIRVESA
jgi:homoserine dehydrogenase